jgi:hypothetical protein
MRLHLATVFRNDGIGNLRRRGERSQIIEFSNVLVQKGELIRPAVRALKMLRHVTIPYQTRDYLLPRSLAETVRILYNMAEYTRHGHIPSVHCASSSASYASSRFVGLSIMWRVGIMGLQTDVT